MLVVKLYPIIISIMTLLASDKNELIDRIKSDHQRTTFNNDELISFIRHMPKVELHAHLNGCIRESTLLELAKERNVKLSSLLHDIQEESHHAVDATEVGEVNVYSVNGGKINKKRRSLEECFEIFGEISKCVTDLVALRRIAKEALEDFAYDGVAYLELRSTPKILFADASNERKCTKREYVETILGVMDEFEQEERERYERELKDFDLDLHDDGIARLPMKARFIVSVNRADSKEDAMEHAELAIQFSQQGNNKVVGVDLSGNPMKNVFKDLEPSFRKVKNSGLKVCIHCGEIPCEIEDNQPIDAMTKFALQDTKDILAFRPDRLGHALLLTSEMYDELERDDNKIPIECCPTSNVMTLELATHHQGDLVHGLIRHPRLAHWIDNNYPISISTDDPGIFNTDSTSELILVLEALKMDNPWGIVSLVMKSIEHAFESDEVKGELLEIFANQLKKLSLFA